MVKASTLSRLWEDWKISEDKTTQICLHSATELEEYKEELI
jgi:hypothetical protein